jgi:hypothetical protein
MFLSTTIIVAPVQGLFMWQLVWTTRFSLVHFDFLFHVE